MNTTLNLAVKIVSTALNVNVYVNKWFNYTHADTHIHTPQKRNGVVL